MPAKVYYDDDADLALLKNKTIAILGYGSQGHAQAQNLRDSGVNVIVGQRPGSANYELAVKHQFKPVSAEDATKQADIVNILLPDEVQGDVYRTSIRPNLKKGAILMASHGFNMHFGQVEPPPGVDAMLVAPKGPGDLVRRTRDYVVALQAEMRSAVEKAVPMRRALAALPPADSTRPVSPNSRRRRNAARVYVEEERKYMGLDEP